MVQQLQEKLEQAKWGRRTRRPALDKEKKNKQRRQDEETVSSRLHPRGFVSKRARPAMAAKTVPRHTASDEAVIQGSNHQREMCELALPPWQLKPCGLFSCGLGRVV